MTYDNDQPIYVVAFGGERFKAVCELLRVDPARPNVHHVTHPDQIHELESDSAVVFDNETTQRNRPDKGTVDGEDFWAAIRETKIIRRSNRCERTIWVDSRRLAMHVIIRESLI